MLTIHRTAPGSDFNVGVTYRLPIHEHRRPWPVPYFVTVSAGYIGDILFRARVLVRSKPGYLAFVRSIQEW